MTYEARLEAIFKPISKDNEERSLHQSGDRISFATIDDAVAYMNGLFAAATINALQKYDLLRMKKNIFATKYDTRRKHLVFATVRFDMIYSHEPTRFIRTRFAPLYLKEQLESVVQSIANARAEAFIEGRAKADVATRNKKKAALRNIAITCKIPGLIQKMQSNGWEYSTVQRYSYKKEHLFKKIYRSQTFEIHFDENLNRPIECKDIKTIYALEELDDNAFIKLADDCAVLLAPTM